MKRHQMHWLLALTAWLSAAGCTPDEQMAASELASPALESHGFLQAGDLSNSVELTHSGRPGADTVHAAALGSGDFDPTFAGGGMVFYSVNGYTQVTGDSTLTQPDGKIIVSGMLTGGSGCQAYVGRFNTNGSIDTTFGSGAGLVTLPIGPQGSTCHQARATLQGDGKIVVATTKNFMTAPETRDFVLLRFTANGFLDTTFGMGGVVTHNYSPGDVAIDVAVTSTGEIVLGGDSSTNGHDFFLARFSNTGALLSQSSHDIQGGSTDVLTQITIQPDGKLLAVGMTSLPSSMNSDFVLVRFNSWGALDTTFGFGGVLRMDVFGSRDEAYAVAVQADGKILVGGTAFYPNNSTYYLTVFRLNSTGTAFDTTFAGTGQSYISFGPPISVARQLALQSDGKILVGGTHTFAEHPALLRFTPTGTLDNTFLSGGGFWFDPTPNDWDHISGVALQPDGKIVLGGESRYSSIRLSRHLR